MVGVGAGAVEDDVGFVDALVAVGVADEDAERRTRAVGFCDRVGFLEIVFADGENGRVRARDCVQAGRNRKR